MSLIQGWFPPTRENWEQLVFYFQFFPLITVFQWIQPWYSAGKTSSESRFNLPGKIAWITMEMPGMMTLLYVMNTLPASLGIEKLPWENKVMGGLYVIHYLHRALIGPLFTPSISPIHPLIWLSALTFQLANALSISGYLSGYGPTTSSAWAHHRNDDLFSSRMTFGLMVFLLGFVSNMWHDDELREIRRAALRKQASRVREAEAEAEANAEPQDASTGKRKAARKGVDKVYMIPRNGLFEYVLYPHYFCEWIEWAGYWVMGGWGFVPGRTFLLNEVATMLPRAVQGRRWYVEKFGREKVGRRRAVIPGIW